MNRYEGMSREQLLDELYASYVQVAELKGTTAEQLSHDLEFEALVKYLTDPDQENPTFINLAPEYIDENPTEEALSYFRELLSSIDKNNEKKNILKNFRNFYPNIYQIIKKELAQKKLEIEKNKPDERTIILKKLKANVIGQKHAISLMASEMSLAIKTKENRVFIFVGPTGTGKSALAKEVSKIHGLFIHFYMNQYTTEVAANTFFGASPGYVGSTAKPHLANHLDEKCKPILISKIGTTEEYEVHNVVMLFDEFEKIHSVVKQSFLAMFDEGVYTANYTKDKLVNGVRDTENLTIRYKFKNCFSIATSNLYAPQILQAFDEEKSIHEICDLFKQLNTSVPSPQSFSPEMLTRIRIVPFGPITQGKQYQKIIKINLDSFFNKLKDVLLFKEIEIEKEENLLAFLEKKLYGKGIDIRRVSGYLEKIQNLINKRMKNWGDLDQIKITFLEKDLGFSIDISKFLPEIEDYEFIENLQLPE